MSMKEAKEVFSKMLRWEQQPKDAEQAEKTIFVGTSINGFFEGVRENIGQNSSKVYEILLKNGQKVSFWGSNLLDGKFKEIPVGSEVVVEYLGIAQPKTPKGRSYQNFKVMFDKDSRKPANLVEAAPAQVATPAPAGAQLPPAQPAPNNGGW